MYLNAGTFVQFCRATNDGIQCGRDDVLRRDVINEQEHPGSFTLPGTSLAIERLGYGAMQLAGPHVFGPPRDRDEAIAVLREAVASGVNHIDTSDYYGPHITNQIIKEALHPYPKGLVIVAKLGARRGADASWIPALSRQEMIDGDHDNLKILGLEVLDVVNLRIGGFAEPSGGSIEEPLTVLAELKRSRSITQSNTHASRACLASSSLDERPADSGDIVPQASPRELEGCVAADSYGIACRS